MCAANAEQYLATTQPFHQYHQWAKTRKHDNWDSTLHINTSLFYFHLCRPPYTKQTITSPDSPNHESKKISKKTPSTPPKMTPKIKEKQSRPLGYKSAFFISHSKLYYPPLYFFVAYSPLPGMTLAAWTALILAIQPAAGCTLRTVRSSSDE